MKGDALLDHRPCTQKPELGATLKVLESRGLPVNTSAPTCRLKQNKSALRRNKKPFLREVFVRILLSQNWS